MATNRQTMSALMFPGLKKILKDRMNVPTIFRSIMQVRDSTRAFETEQGITGFGYVPLKREGEEAAYDDPIQGFPKVFLHEAYSLKYRITREAIDDDQYGELGKRMAANLEVSCRATQERLAGFVLNNAFTDATGSPDGMPLCSTAHPLLGGGVYGNMPTIPAALSGPSLQNGITTLRRTLTDRGIQSMYKATHLVVPPELQFLAKQLMASTKVLGSNYNDPNPVMGEFNVIVDDYITNPDMWFLMVEQDQRPIIWYDRVAITPEDYTDNSTRDVVFGVYFRSSAGFNGWRGIYGSPGS